jgi:acyl dehydratase
MPQADLSYDAIELGKSYGPYKYPLSERIARILEATDNAHPWHHGRSPWGPPVAPPSILGSICMRFIDWIAPIAPGTLHTRQDVRTDAALRLDRQPIAYGEFVEKYERRGRRWAVFEARFRDETGLIIGHGRTTLVFPERVETKDEPEADARPAKREGELTPITREITERKIAGASASRNSIGTEELLAADYISEMMTGVLGKEWFEYADLSLDFLAPIDAGDTLTVNGRLKEKTPQGAVLHKVYEVWAVNQRGEAVAAGSAGSLAMPGR